MALDFPSRAPPSILFTTFKLDSLKQKCDVFTLFRCFFIRWSGHIFESFTQNNVWGFFSAWQIFETFKVIVALKRGARSLILLWGSRTDVQQYSKPCLDENILSLHSKKIRPSSSGDIAFQRNSIFTYINVRQYLGLSGEHEHPAVTPKIKCSVRPRGSRPPPY